MNSCYTPSLDSFSHSLNESKDLDVANQTSVGNETYGQCQLDNVNGTAYIPCSKWVYDESQYKSTIISEVTYMKGSKAENIVS